jgi:hypothetical protein
MQRYLAHRCRGGGLPVCPAEHRDIRKLRREASELRDDFVHGREDLHRGDPRDDTN